MESVYLLQSILLSLCGSIQEVALVSYGLNFHPSHQSLLQLASLYPTSANQHHLHEQGHVHLVPRAAERAPDRDCLCGEYQLSPPYRRPENPDQDGGSWYPIDSRHLLVFEQTCHGAWLFKGPWINRWMDGRMDRQMCRGSISTGERLGRNYHISSLLPSLSCLVSSCTKLLTVPPPYTLPDWKNYIPVPGSYFMLNSPLTHWPGTFPDQWRAQSACWRGPQDMRSSYLRNFPEKA